MALARYNDSTERGSVIASSLDQTARCAETTKGIREAEADAVAFVVFNAIGLMSWLPPAAIQTAHNYTPALIHPPAASGFSPAAPPGAIGWNAPIHQVD